MKRPEVSILKEKRPSEDAGYCDISGGIPTLDLFPG